MKVFIFWKSFFNEILKQKILLFDLKYNFLLHLTEDGSGDDYQFCHLSKSCLPTPAGFWYIYYLLKLFAAHVTTK